MTGAILALTLAAAGIAYGSGDPFLGTWKANAALTKLSVGTPEARKSEIMTIDDMGLDHYRVTRVTPDGNSSSIGLNFDGKERTGEPGSSAIGIKVGPRHYRNSVKGPKGTLVSDWVVSPDGQRLTNQRKGTGTATGRAIDEVLVYDLQPDPPAPKKPKAAVPIR